MNANLQDSSNPRDNPPTLRIGVGEHVVDLGALRVVSRPESARLTSKAAAVLVELARNSGSTLTRDQLLDRVWKNRVTTPDVLTQAIKELRRAFADHEKPSRYIETIPKVGYRLLVPVSFGDESASAPLAPASVGADLEPDRPASNKTARRGYVLGATAIAILLVLGLFAVRKATTTMSADTVGWTSQDLRTITYDPGPERRPHISPDGTRVAYSQLDQASGFERIVVRSIDQSQRLHLTARATGNERMPAWSPDGTRIAFERVDADNSCVLYVVPSLGGAESEIGICANPPVFFDWTPDGSGLLISQPSSAGGLELAVLDIASGNRSPLQYQRGESDQDVEAHYSPNKKWIAFRRGPASFSDLFIMRAEGGDVRQLTRFAARIPGFGWTPDSGGLVFSSNSEGQYELKTVSIDGGLVHALNVAPATYPNVALNTGTVVYEIPRTKARLAQADLAEGTVAPRLLAPSTGSDSAPAFAPTGKDLVFVSNRGGSQQLWVYDGTDATMLTEFRSATLFNPTWNKDGKRVLVTVRNGGQTVLNEIDIASRRSQAVARSQTGLLSGIYGPGNDSYLLIRLGADGRGELVSMQHADSSQETIRILAAEVERVEWDPTAQMVYYTKSDAGGLFRRPITEGAEQAVTPTSLTISKEGWRIVDGHVWYLSGSRVRPFELRAFDEASGTERRLARVDGELRNLNFSVTPARDSIAFAPMGPEDVDVGAFRLIASGAQ